MPIIGNKANTNELVEKREYFYIVVNANWYSHCGKTVGRFLRKLKIELPYDLAILLLGIYPYEMKSLSKRDICIPMFIVALFTIVKL